MNVVGTEPRTIVMTITPELAKRFLERIDSSQRKPSPLTVDRYATDMSMGRWELTHQGIAFNQSGELVDGQHRMHAVIKSGVTIKTPVTTGLPIAYQSAIDGGWARTLSQVTGLGTTYIAAVNRLRALESGDFRIRKISPAILSEVGTRWKDPLARAFSLIGQTWRRSPASYVAAVAFAIDVATERIESFTRQVKTGELIERGDPAYQFRRWMDGASQPGRRISRRGDDVIFASLNCMRYEAVGQKLTAVYTGAVGYRAFCSARRRMGLPNTPSADQTGSISFTSPAAASVKGRVAGGRLARARYESTLSNTNASLPDGVADALSEGVADDGA